MCYGRGLPNYPKHTVILDSSSYTQHVDSYSSADMALRATVCFRTYTSKLSSTALLNLRLAETSAVLRIPLRTLTLRTAPGASPAFGAHSQRWCIYRYAVYRSQIYKMRAAYSNGASGKGTQGQGPSGSAPRLSNTERIKVLVKEYGTVAVVFHTIMSLFSLGTCYLLVSK